MPLSSRKKTPANAYVPRVRRERQQRRESPRTPRWLVILTRLAKGCCTYKILVALLDLVLICHFWVETGYPVDYKTYARTIASDRLPIQTKFEVAGRHVTATNSITRNVGDMYSAIEKSVMWQYLLSDPDRRLFNKLVNEEPEALALLQEAMENPLVHLAVMYPPAPFNKTTAGAILEAASDYAARTKFSSTEIFVRENVEVLAEHAREMMRRMERHPLGLKTMRSRLRSYDRWTSEIGDIYLVVAVFRMVFELILLSLALCGFMNPSSAKGKFLITIPLRVNFATMVAWACYNNLFHGPKPKMYRILTGSMKWDFYGQRPMATFASFGFAGKCLFMIAEPDLSSPCYWLHVLHICEQFLLNATVGSYCSYDEFDDIYYDFQTKFFFELKSFLLHCAFWLVRKVKGLLLELKQAARKKESPETVWFQACMIGNCKTLRQMIKEETIQNLNIQSEKHNGDTGLAIACRQGIFSVVQLLLDRGKETVDPNIGLPLTISSRLGHASIVARLLRCKNLCLDNGCGVKAIAEAVRNDHFKVAIMIQTVMQERHIGSKNVRVLIKKTMALSAELKRKKLTQVERTEKQDRLQQCKDHILQANVYKDLVLTNTEEEKSNNRMESIEDFTDCNICFDSLAGRKIFACSNDHWMCEACKRAKIKECPFCKEDFREKIPRRCHQVEALVNFLVK